MYLVCDSCVMVLLKDLDKINEIYQSVANQLTSLNASSIAWTQLNRLNASIEEIAVSLSLSDTNTLSDFYVLGFAHISYVCIIMITNYNFMPQNAIRNYNSTLDESRNRADVLEGELQVIDLDIKELGEKV